MIDLRHGDCLEVMKELKDGSIDLILTDPPYGMTAPTWDSVVPFDCLWKEYRRILKPDGVSVVFGSQPFTTNLIASNKKEFKYCWYWLKNQGTNFFHAKRMPIRKVEEICVFGGKTYYPQISEGHPPTQAARGCSNGKTYHGTNIRDYEGGKTTRYPVNILEFPCVNNYKRIHSSEKPIGLLEYLIRTYTQESDLVLDPFAGSGSTLVACNNLNRRCIGIELDDEYYKKAQERLDNAPQT